MLGSQSITASTPYAPISWSGPAIASRPWFTTAARLSGNDAQAEDIAQEVFLRAHRKFDELRGNPRAAGWLKTVATNLTFTHLTRYRKRWVFFSQMQPADEAEDDPVLDFADDESVVEHVRDVANFLAFGPGFLHFHSTGTWRRAWRSAGVHDVCQFRVTPFVRVFVLKPAQ